jgi:hypothetical protein
MKPFAIGSTLLVMLCFAAVAQADQYPILAPGYTQEIFTGPLQSGEGGTAWTSNGNLLTRRGSDIIEYNLTQNLVHQGTNVHGAIATHAITGLPSTGVGMTNGLDGYVYTITGSGLYRFKPSNWAAPAEFLTGTPSGAQGYGITTLPDGRIAYTDSAGTSSVWVYTPNANPNLGTNTWVYTAPANYLIDGMVAGPTGALALAGQTYSGITIISSSGSLIQSFTTPHYPDGMAFGGDPTIGALYSNNNDGTISKYVLGLGYTNAPVITDIATGSGAYGDLAAVGPDCAFYVSQYQNGNYHGATPGVGTNWNLGTNAEASFIRIGSLGGADGTPNTICEFYTPLETAVPLPTAVWGGMILLGVLAGAEGLKRLRRQEA